MNEVNDIFGHGKDLSIFQMSCRGIAVFLIALLLIRISGRRSFGVRNPIDNIIVILLGAILSRAIVGISPFWPIVITSLAIVVLRRILGRLLLRYQKFKQLVEGEKILLYNEGNFIHEKMRKAMLNEEEIMQGIRKTASTDSLENIKTIYIESNGEITCLKKKNE